MENQKSNETIYTKLTETNELMEEMAQHIDTVNEVASNLAAVSEEGSASTAEISESVEEIAVSSDRMAQTSKDVAGAAGSVSEAVHHFGLFFISYSLMFQRAPNPPESL